MGDYTFATIMIVALFAFAFGIIVGESDRYKTVNIELACRQEFNKKMASASADICPSIIKNLEEKK